MSVLDIALPQLDHPHEVDDFDRNLKEVCWKMRETDDGRKAELFSMCLGEGSSAESWFENVCPTEAKTTWSLIRVQLFDTFRTKESDAKHLQKLQTHTLSDTDAQDEQKRWDWVKLAKAYCKKVTPSYMCDEAKANIIKANIGPETRNLMTIKENTVEGVCEALRILDEFQVGIIKKRLETADVKESVTAWTNKVNAKEAEIARLIRLLNINATTTHQGTTTTNVGNQVATTSSQLVVRPKTTTTIATTGRTQNQAPQTAEQKAKYAAWKAVNGDNVWFGCDLPTYGKEPLGSNECNGCGTKGHRAVDCQADKLDFLEQKLRKIHNDRARAEKQSRYAASVMTPTTIEPVHLAGDVEETGGKIMSIEEGNGAGQE
jgi:hypothetical protein